MSSAWVRRVCVVNPGEFNAGHAGQRRLIHNYTTMETMESVRWHQNLFFFGEVNFSHHDKTVSFTMTQTVCKL